VVWRRIRTYGITVLAGVVVNKNKGDIVEENDEQTSILSLLRIQTDTPSMISLYLFLDLK
jgi:hypothetical protein